MASTGTNRRVKSLQEPLCIFNTTVLNLLKDQEESNKDNCKESTEDSVLHIANKGEDIAEDIIVLQMKTKLLPLLLNKETLTS